MQQYQHTGGITVAGIVWGFSAGILSAFVLSIAYVYATFHLPIMEANLVGAVILGALVGECAAKGASTGKAQSRPAYLALGFVSGLCAVYFSWAFCAPVRSYFDDVAQPAYRVGNRMFYHPLNGAYGISLRTKVAGQNVLHLGADVAWHRPGEPVFAVAAGVVRVSAGPSGDPKDKERAGASDRDNNAQPRPDDCVHLPGRL